MKPKNYPAYRIAEYLEIYLKYLEDNNLGDDSKDITVQNLIGFVEEIILPDIEEVLVEYEEKRTNPEEPNYFALYQEKLKVQSDNTISIKIPEERVYSRTHVIDLITRYGRDVFRNGREHSKWIEENL